MKLVHAEIIYHVLIGEFAVACFGFQFWGWTPTIILTLFLFSAATMILVYFIIHKMYQRND